MYDYYLGGKDNFEADRQAAQRMISQIPQIPAAAKDNRHFLRNAVTAVAQAGIRQFIDIGSGLPTMENTHEAACGVAADVKVAYVDRDPQAVTHARAILRKGDEETVFVLDGDLREPTAITHFLGDFMCRGKRTSLSCVFVSPGQRRPDSTELPSWSCGSIRVARSSCLGRDCGQGSSVLVASAMQLSVVWPSERRSEPAHPPGHRHRLASPFGFGKDVAGLGSGGRIG